ncbi:MAG: HlyD family secretion protein [Reyranella sp.]|jgi:membrane fusion protein (multidrug efflux system)|uniref:HlyD family secretion protein n=1 Tax=Reyranella sp. TaxID=1929291 RepID=UPI0009613831|nr:HlyD family secretion protein [Reyranella sp.]MBN9540503.1 HlyD family secretion protein [Alphaproteobacteria bacterium]MBR2819129.1 HlyD family secretion protein [Reyranella sp.]OJU43453.1 MAG: hemolysin D [Alphaproteobacteria bacterium 65-37]
MSEIPKAETFQGADPVSEAAATTAASTTARRLPAARLVLKRGLLALAGLVGTAAVAYWGHGYWTTGRYLESTNDAYVKADYTTIAPKVSGYIADVLVKDNESVKAGQVLARIDDRDFRAALDEALAKVEASQAAIRNLDAQVALQQSMIAQAKAQVVATKATLVFAKADAERYHDLVKTGAGTLQRSQQTQSLRDATVAQLQRDEAALAASEARIAVLTSEREQAVAQRARDEATAEQARLNLGYTTIVAPVAGTVGARSLRVGQYVAAGTQLMAVVPLDAVYVVANFKETQLTYVRSGQPVEIEIDSFPGVTLKGHVDSLAPASGLEFALLPPDNATGNFTKIVQRIPVKIVFDPSELNGLLRPGMSVEPSIDTKSAARASSPAG